MALSTNEVCEDIDLNISQLGDDQDSESGPFPLNKEVKMNVNHDINMKFLPKEDGVAHHDFDLNKRPMELENHDPDDVGNKVLVTMLNIFCPSVHWSLPKSS